MEAFATPTIVHFCVVLLLAAIVSTPGQTPASLSLCFGLTGVGGLVYSSSVAFRMRRQPDYAPVLEDWIWHSGLPISAYGCLVMVGLFFRSHPAAALYWSAATSLLLLYVGIHNAWDAAIYISMKSKEQ